jgi:heterotetrameric sarcosine oxidase gamma subunit
MQFHTPFYDMKPEQHANPDGEMGVRFSPSPLACAWQLHTWVQGQEAFFSNLAAYFEIPAMGETKYLADDTLLVRSGPVELSLFNRKPSPLSLSIVQSLNPELGAALDLSHAKMCVQMLGDKVVPSLQKRFALDLRLVHFPVGRFCVSGFHHAPAALHRVSEHDFDLYLLTTYAKDQLASLMDAALEFGYVLDTSTDVKGSHAIEKAP